MTSRDGEVQPEKTPAGAGEAVTQTRDSMPCMRASGERNTRRKPKGPLMYPPSLVRKARYSPSSVTTVAHEVRTETPDGRCGWNWIISAFVNYEWEKALQEQGMAVRHQAFA